MKPGSMNALEVVNMTALFRSIWEINMEMLLHWTVESSIELMGGKIMKSTFIFVKGIQYGRICQCSLYLVCMVLE